MIITISFTEHIIVIMNRISGGAGPALKTHREHFQKFFAEIGHQLLFIIRCLRFICVTKNFMVHGKVLNAPIYLLFLIFTVVLSLYMQMIG